MKTGITFAFNEAPKKKFESHLIESVKSIRECVKSGSLDNAFFLNDGSTDNTEEIILSLIRNYENIYLISSKVNLGKLKILSYGLKIINEFIPFQDEDLIVTTDSDMMDFQGKHIKEMVAVMKRNDTDMVVANCYSGGERLDYIDVEYSGTRAIKVHLLKGFYDERHPDFEYLKPFFNYTAPQKGYCLEKVLNLLTGRYKAKNDLPNYSLVVELDLHFRKAGKGHYNKDGIDEGLKFFEKTFKLNKSDIFSYCGKLLNLKKIE